MNKIENIYKRFWYIDDGENYIGATDIDIENVEKYWGVKLPQEYIELPKICNVRSL